MDYISILDFWSGTVILSVLRRNKCNFCLTKLYFSSLFRWSMSQTSVFPLCITEELTHKL